jgi:hypothetical protein
LRHFVELGADLRHLSYTDQETNNKAVYYNLTLTDLLALTRNLSVSGQAAITGSQDVRIRPAVSGTVNFSTGQAFHAGLTVSRSTLLPQPEMLYGVYKVAALVTDTIDYSINGDAELEPGAATGIELSLHRTAAFYEARLRGGYFSFSDLPAWSIAYDSLLFGEHVASNMNCRLMFASVECRVAPHGRLTGLLTYGIRDVADEGETLTLGPQHTAAALLLYRLPIRRLAVFVNLGAGAEFRSASNRYFIGAPEDGVMTVDSYLGFDLKRFHFFFNFDNLLDTEYTLGGLRQRGRSYWWGFKWTLLD